MEIYGVGRRIASLFETFREARLPVSAISKICGGGSQTLYRHLDMLIAAGFLAADGSAGVKVFERAKANEGIARGAEECA